MLQLRHLRYFEAVAECGSFNRAARVLRIAQPPLSRQIRMLEDMLGGPLFERRPHGVGLTLAALRLAERTAAIREGLERAVTRARLADAGRTGSVRLALGRGSIGDRRLGAGIAALRVHLPEVEFVIDELSAIDQLEALRARRIDVGIGVPGDRSGSGIAAATLFDESINGAVLPSAHRLASSSSIRVADLANDRLILLRDGDRTHWTRLFDAVRRAGVADWEELDSVEAVFGAVAAGRGWSVAVSALRNTPPWGTVVRPFEDFELPVSVVAQYRANDDRRLIANVLSILRGEPASTRLASGAPDLRGWPAFELRELEAVLTTRHFGAIGTSAQANRLSPSSIARRVAAVERVLGCRLFERGTAIELTPAGEAFCDAADGVLQRVANTYSEVRRCMRGVRGICRVAVVPGMAESLGVQLRALSAVRSEIAVEIHEMLSEAQVDALEQRRIDVAIGGAHLEIDESSPIGSRRLMDNPIDSVLVAESHPLARRRELHVPQLATLPFFFLDRSVSPAFYDLVTESLEPFGLSPDPRGRAAGIHSMWRLVADSCGWTIAPRALHAHAPPGTVAVPVAGLSIPWGLSVRWHREDTNPVTAAVLDVIGGFSAAEN